MLQIYAGGALTAAGETAMLPMSLTRGNKLYNQTAGIYASTGETINALFSKASDYSFYLRRAGDAYSELNQRVSKTMVGKNSDITPSTPEGAMDLAVTGVAR